MSSRRGGERNIPIIVAGGLDTKSNPKLLKPGAVLQLDNMVQLRTGELRARNGYERLLASASSIGTGDIFAGARGGLAAVASSAVSGGNWNFPYPVAAKYGVAGVGTWNVKNARGTPYPVVTARITGAPVAMQTSGGQVLAQVDAVSPDLGLASSNSSNIMRVCVYANSSGTSTNMFCDAIETVGFQPPVPGTFPLTGGSAVVVAGAAAKIVSLPTGSGLGFAVFYQSATNTLTAKTFSSSGALQSTRTIVTDIAANGFFDVKLIPGQTSTENVALAYAASGGGIKCGLCDPFVGTPSPLVATAGGDANLTLGWLDDQQSTGSMYLVTAGTTSGLVLRQMSATTFVVSTTQTLDATATASVNNVTGHIILGGGACNVYWDLIASPRSADRVMATQVLIGTSTTVPKLYHGNHSLYSRSVQFPNGRYYFLCANASTAQPLYTLVPCDGGNANITTLTCYPSCVILSGEGGGARAACSLTTPVVSGSTVTMAVQRARKITTPTGSSSQARTVAYATFSVLSKLNHARELGGTVFLPGGLIHRDDGATIEPATFPLYPEPPTSNANAAGGAMTATGTYLYRLVLRATDATGRVARSAASIPYSVTLAAGETKTTLTFPEIDALRGDTDFLSYGSVVLEFYRQGPAASGATLYNKVGEQSAWVYYGNGGVGGAFVDAMSDANAALGEAAYFNGNTLENFHPPATTVLEVNDTRVGIINAEDPTEFWFSKEYKQGTGLAFNPQNKVQITGDGAGDLTALAAMDGRWLLFKKTAIYVMSGTGPNDLGQGGYSPPQAITRTIGTVNPSSIIETPEGVLFQAQTGGIWLVGRDLSVTYVGAPVEQYALAEQVIGAAPTGTLPTVRLVFPSGRMVEWDYFHKKWYSSQLRVTVSSFAYTVTGCAASPVFGWCYALSNGDVMSEVAGQLYDHMTDGTFNAIIPTISLPHLDFAGLAGYQRLKSLDIVIDVRGNHTLSVSAEFDYSGALIGAKTIALTTATPTVEIEWLPPEGKAKCSACRPVITVTGSPTNGTFRLTSVTAVVLFKRGTNIPAGSRLT